MGQHNSHNLPITSVHTFNTTVWWLESVGKWHCLLVSNALHLGTWPLTHLFIGQIAAIGVFYSVAENPNVVSTWLAAFWRWGISVGLSIFNSLYDQPLWKNMRSSTQLAVNVESALHRKWCRFEPRGAQHTQKWPNESKNQGWLTCANVCHTLQKNVFVV